VFLVKHFRNVQGKVTLSLILIWICATVAVCFEVAQSRAAAALDTPEAEEVKAAIQRAKEAIATAQNTGDLHRLEDGLVDHPDYLRQLRPEQQEELRNFIAKILGTEASKNPGYLTAISNKISYRLQGEAFVKAAIEGAKAEGREFTNEDLQSLAAEHPDKHIVWPKSEADLALPEPTQRSYKSIEIDGDKARAVYDDGIRDKTAILVRIDGRWYVAGIF
jgi:hypothetical protein